MMGKRKRDGDGGNEDPSAVAENDTLSAQELEQQIAYEKERNDRVERNRRRMSELGLLDLSQQMSKCRTNKHVESAIRAKSKLNRIKNLNFQPPRRSSRLQGTPCVSYRDNFKEESKRVSSWRELNLVGSKPEIYTEEDVKLLGSCETPWELFRDGYDANGSRIYDSVHGKTCHQCRQKTLGHRTWCSSCESLHGQFCGDCLFMRYGENVLEAKANKKWVCPVCRGICNCSLCRPKRGWRPTGLLYRRVAAEGYKSVAHYLMTTCRAVSHPSASPGNGSTEEAEQKMESATDGQSNANDGCLEPSTPSPLRSNPRKAEILAVFDVETGRQMILETECLPKLSGIGVASGEVEGKLLSPSAHVPAPRHLEKNTKDRLTLSHQNKLEQCEVKCEDTASVKPNAGVPEKKRRTNNVVPPGDCSNLPMLLSKAPRIRESSRCGAAKTSGSVKCEVTAGSLVPVLVISDSESDPEGTTKENGKRRRPVPVGNLHNSEFISSRLRSSQRKA